MWGWVGLIDNIQRRRCSWIPKWRLNGIGLGRPWRWLRLTQLLCFIFIYTIQLIQQWHFFVTTVVYDVCTEQVVTSIKHVVRVHSSENVNSKKHVHTSSLPIFRSLCFVCVCVCFLFGLIEFVASRKMLASPVSTRASSLGRKPNRRKCSFLFQPYVSLSSFERSHSIIAKSYPKRWRKRKEKDKDKEKNKKKKKEQHIRTQTKKKQTSQQPSHLDATSESNEKERAVPSPWCPCFLFSVVVTWMSIVGRRTWTNIMHTTVVGTEVNPALKEIIDHEVHWKTPGNGNQLHKKKTQILRGITGARETRK